MAVAPFPNQEQVIPTPRRWTVAEFDHLIDSGAFGPEERLELIEGELIPKRSQYPPHATALTLSISELIRVFTAGFVVRIQMPVTLGENPGNRPEPDIAVVTGSARDYTAQHPTTAALLVEISDSTLLYDRTTKASLYARAGMAELWVLNLPDRLLEVFREPTPMAGQPFRVSLPRYPALHRIRNGFSPR